MNIRPAADSDCTAVQRLVEELEETAFDPDAFRSVFSAEIKDPRWHAFVCEKDGRIIAFANLRIEHQLHHAALVAELLELITAEAWRNQKIGEAMFSYVCTYAKEQGCVQIELNSSMRRKDARRFYEVHGMTKDHFNFTMPL